MRTTFGIVAATALFAGCMTEQEKLRQEAEDLAETRQEARENVAEEVQEARREVGRAMQEGREEIAEARADYLQQLREFERANTRIGLEGEVVSADAERMVLRLRGGETVEIVPTKNATYTQANQTVDVTVVPVGATVHVVYRRVGDRREFEQADVRRAPTPPAGTE